MSRTNIDIDDELIGAVMQEFNLRTKREAVDFALRRARRRGPLTVEEVQALRGIGWDGDLDQLRTGRTFDRAEEQ